MLFRSQHAAFALHRLDDERGSVVVDRIGECVDVVKRRECEAAARRSEAADLHFDNGLTLTAGLVIPFPPRSELLSTGDQEPKPFSFVHLPCQKFDPLEFQATVQRARVFDGRTYTLE